MNCLVINRNTRITLVIKLNFPLYKTHLLSIHISYVFYMQEKFHNLEFLYNVPVINIILHLYIYVYDNINIKSNLLKLKKRC